MLGAGNTAVDGKRTPVHGELTFEEGERRAMTKQYSRSDGAMKKI